MGNLDHGAAAVNLMAVLQSIDYNKSERFSNIAHQIFAKLLSNFLECEMLVVTPDRYGFEFSIKSAERKYRTENSSNVKEIEIIDNRKVAK